jgi:hypothetical protein
MTDAARPHIHVATPCYGGLVTQSYMQSVLRLMQHAATAGFDLSLSLLGNDSLITRSRNTLVARFLDQPEATHLLFIDADIGFAPEQVERMVRARRDVVAGLYPLKMNDWDEAARGRLAAGEAFESAALRYVGLIEEGARPDAQGLVRGTYAGTGFLLIARAALLRMIEAYPETHYRAIQSWPPRPESPQQYALFECMIEPETRIYLSEDYSFCRRWRDIGGEIWLDTIGSLTHSGACDFTGRPEVRWPGGAAPG